MEISLCVNGILWMHFRCHRISISWDIHKKLEKDWELNMDTFCRQGYDGAGSMAGKRKGVAARIMKKYPKAFYIHCASHILNLCIVEATSIIDVRNMMNVTSCVAWFSNNSPKRQLPFDKFIDEQHETTESSSTRAKLKDLCKWVERHDAFEALYVLYYNTYSVLKKLQTLLLVNGKEKQLLMQIHI